MRAGPAALCSVPTGNPGGRADPRLQPMHRHGLVTLRHSGGGGRARDSPSSPAAAEESPCSGSQTGAAMLSPNLCWALVPQLSGGFCTAEMCPRSRRAEFLGDSKHPGRLADALGCVSPLPEPLLVCLTCALTPPGSPRSKAQALLPLLVEALGFLPPPRDHLGFHCHLSVRFHGNQ